MLDTVEAALQCHEVASCGMFMDVHFLLPLHAHFPNCHIPQEIYHDFVVSLNSVHENPAHLLDYPGTLIVRDAEGFPPSAIPMHGSKSGTRPKVRGQRKQQTVGKLESFTNLN